MALTAMTLRSERWLDEVTVTGSIVNVGGADVAELFSLPLGLGDVAIMEAIVVGSDIATVVAGSTNPSVRIDILSPDGASAVDIVGVFRWWPIAVAAVAAYVSPDPLVLWKQDERLRISSVEFDTNASPTGDLSITVKCVRVRPIEVSEQPRPLRLVR